MKIQLLIPVLLLVSGFISYADSMMPPDNELTKQDTSIRSTINFEKIIWYSSVCSYNKCPVFSLMVTNNRDFKIHKLVYRWANLSELDTLQSGNFEGVLDDSTYSALMMCLNNSHINTIPSHDSNRPPLLLDMSSGLLVIHYNNETKYLWTLDATFPDKMSEVLHFLGNIENKIKLKRTSALFEFN